MKFTFYLCLLILAACGVRQSSVDYGKTSVADLVALKGEPLEEVEVPLRDAKVLIYESNEKYQVRNNVVTHGFKDPKREETSVIFWRHRFKDCETSLRKLSIPKDDELVEYELSCPSRGLSVIYSDGSDFISRVVEHERN
jgi:hypothetical protein